MWQIILSGRFDANEGAKVTTERYDTQEEAREAFVGALQSLDVIVFGPYVRCECDRSTCNPCDLVDVARAYERWLAERPDLPLSFTWEYSGFSVDASDMGAR